MKRGRSKSAPKYRLHKRSGQAVVSINGKDIYLGKHSTEESQQRYRAAIADHWASPTEAPHPPKNTRNLMLSVSIQAAPPAAISSLDAIVLVVVTNEDSTTRKPLPPSPNSTALDCVSNPAAWVANCWR